MSGKIYKLTCSETGKVYYGSTKLKLQKRFNGHKSGQNNTTSKELIKPTIELVELVDLKIIKERERYYIENFECVNKNVAGRNQQESHKLSQKKYYEKHKDEINEKQKFYRDKNKIKNNERLKEKITCSCGSVVSYVNLQRHKKTKKHLELTHPFS